MGDATEEATFFVQCHTLTGWAMSSCQLSYGMRTLSGAHPVRGTGTWQCQGLLSCGASAISLSDSRRCGPFSEATGLWSCVALSLLPVFLKPETGTDSLPFLEPHVKLWLGWLES